MNNTELEGYLQELFAEDKDNFLNAPPESKAIRVNTLKISKDRFIERLKKWKVAFSILPFNGSGIEIYDDPLPLSHTIDFFRGYFQYQGISSQIPALVLDPKPGDRVLDIAAAPGSKSTQLAALMHNKGELCLNDISHGRLQPLNVNAQRAGVINHVIMNLAGERYGSIYPEYFDKILVDAPCTALGTLATSPEVFGWWNLGKLNKLCISQRQLLISALKALRVGGEMVYSTCSVSPEENEAQIQWLLENYPVEILDIPLKEYFPDSDAILRYGGKNYSPGLSRAIRVSPHLHNMEGFFVIRLRKTGKIFSAPYARPVKWNYTICWDDPAVRIDLLEISEKWGISEEIWPEFRYIRTRNRIWMMDRSIKKVLTERFQNAGLLLGESKLKGWKLTNQSVQYLDEKITRGRLQLGELDLTELFAKGNIPVNALDFGYHVLEWDGKALASVYCENDMIKLRLPHFFRLML